MRFARRVFWVPFFWAGACRVISAPCLCLRRLPCFVLQVAFLAGSRCFVSFSGFCCSLVSPDWSLSCTYRVGRHSVALPRCVPRFCDFCKWPIRPDGCAPPVASPRRRLPGFSRPVVLLFCLPLRRFGVTASPDPAASFCAPGFPCAVFCNRSVPRACACSRLLLSGSVVLSCLADYFFLAVYNRPVASAPASFRFRVPGRGVPVSVSSFCLPSSVAPLLSRRIAGFCFCSLPFWLFPPVCVAPLVPPVCCSASFSRLRYPVSLFPFRPGSCRSLRLPNSAFPVFATMHRPRNVAPSCLLGCAAQLLCLSSRFPVFLGWLRLSCLCCFLYLLLRSHVFSAILLRCYFPSVVPSFCFSRLLRFSYPVAFFRLRRPVAAVRSLLRFRIWRSARSPRTRDPVRPLSRRAAGAIRSTCARLTPLFVRGVLREKCAAARNSASLGGIRVRDQGYEFGRGCRSDSLEGGVRDRVLVEATV